MSDANIKKMTVKNKGTIKWIVNDQFVYGGQQWKFLLLK